MGKVIIMSGCSGSGKSTYIQNEILGRKTVNGCTTFEKMPDTFTIVSADHFFEDDAGVYHFDPTKIGEAHAQCFREFIDALQSKVDLVVVDNTNTTESELAPYVLGASAFGYEHLIITLTVDVRDLNVCVERNAHKVPAGVIQSQHYRLCQRRLPKHFNNNSLSADVYNPNR